MEGDWEGPLGPPLHGCGYTWAMQAAALSPCSPTGPLSSPELHVLRAFSSLGHARDLLTEAERASAPLSDRFTWLLVQELVQKLPFCLDCSLSG